MKHYRLGVCKGPDCTRNGGGLPLFEAVRARVAELKLTDKCEVVRGGCYGLCHLGPNLVLREAVPGKKKDPFSREDFELLGVPGEFHYAGVTREQAVRIVEQHVRDERPVEEWTGPRRAASAK